MSEDKVTKRGMAAGTTMAGIGGAMLGVAHGDKFIKPEKLISARKNLIKRTGSAKAAKEFLKSSKATGAATLAIGSGIAGVSAYKHYKNKKKASEDNKG